MSFDYSRISSKLNAMAQSFANKEARAGWFSTARYEDGTPVAYVASIQENGAPGQGIPPRPFIRPTVASKQKDWSSLAGKGATAVLSGTHTLEDVLAGVGAQIAGDMGTALAQVSGPALSPVTILLRKWRREGRPITGATVGQAAAALAKDPSLISGANADLLHDTGLLQATLTHMVGDSE